MPDKGYAVMVLKRASILSLVLTLSAIAVLCPAMPVGLHDPFHARNQNPLIQLTGLPPTEGADLARRSTLEARLILDIANNFTSAGDPNSEYVRLDGETWRLTAMLRYGLTDNIELGIDLPYTWHSAGVFDDFIVNWHDFFRLPPGGRTTDNSYDVTYCYNRGSDVLLRIENATEGISDVSLSLGLRLYGDLDSKRSVTCRAGIKLPTGDPHRLTGNGSTDLSLRLCGRDSSLFERIDAVLNGTIGVLCLGDGDVLPDQQSDLVGFGSLGICGMFWKRIVPKVQLDWHTAAYEGTDLRQAGGYWANQVTFGLGVTLNADTRLDLAMSEDLVVSSSPDVALHVALVKTM